MRLGHHLKRKEGEKERTPICCFTSPGPTMAKAELAWSPELGMRPRFPTWVAVGQLPELSLLPLKVNLTEARAGSQMQVLQCVLWVLTSRLNIQPSGKFLWLAPELRGPQAKQQPHCQTALRSCCVSASGGGFFFF